jgi:hypothetical protein
VGQRNERGFPSPFVYCALKAMVKTNNDEDTESGCCARRSNISRHGKSLGLQVKLKIWRLSREDEDMFKCEVEMCFLLF